MGTEAVGPDILGVEMTPSVIRAVRLNRDDRKVVRAAECPVLNVGAAVALDPAAIGPALDEVMYQLAVDDRTEHLAAVSIGPLRAGVGSGPALPAWLEHRARQLGENIVCAGKLGISFCPQRALDTAIMICEQANITVSRIDFAPVAAARVLNPGVETVQVGSGRGWQARLRDDEVLEAAETSEVSIDDRLQVVTADGVSVSVDGLHSISLASEAKSVIGTEPGHYAVSVGTAVGIIDGSSGNLLDGDTVRGRQVPAVFASEVGGVNTGEIAGSRTTVNLARVQGEPEARSVIRQVGTVVEPPGESVEFGADSVGGEVSLLGASKGSRFGDSDGGGSPLDGLHDAGADGLRAGAESGSLLGLGLDADFDAGRETDLEVHPDDPIRSFSPEPGAEATMDRQGRGRLLAFVVAGLILFSLAIAIGILMTRG